MFRCPRAAPASPFRLRFYRFAPPQNVPRPSPPSSGIRPRRPGPRPTVLAAAVAGTALAACADSVWEPPGDGPGAEDGRPMAALVSETPLRAVSDADEPPPWLEAIRSMESEGCVIHYRRADGTYASVTYGLRYGHRALARDGRWRALVYSVTGIVTRPSEGGGIETLPERLGVRAACLLPDTERGLEEAEGRVEAILEVRGIPGFGPESADADFGAVSADAGLGWAARALAALGRLAVRPLAAVQQRCYVYPPSMFGVGCPASPPVSNGGDDTPISIGCPAGFDFEYASARCVRTGSSPVPPTQPPASGSSGGGNGNKGQTNLRDVEFTLSCPGSVTRGSSAVCRVGTDDDEVVASTIHYDWSAGVNGKSGKGRAFVTWSGLATSTKTVSVEVSAAGIKTKKLSTTVRVSARPSFFPSSAAGVSTEHFDATTWGKFDIPLEAPDGPRVVPGQGPWFGEWIAASHGFKVPTAIVLSSDLDETGVAYGGANQTCLTSLPDTATVNVYGANYRCGLSSELAQLYAILLAHEREHESSWNMCLASSKGRAFIDYAEGVLPKTGSEAQEALDEKWEQFWPTLLASAYGSVTDRTGPTVWSWRGNQTWQKYQHDAPGHGIPLGCR